MSHGVSLKKKKKCTITIVASIIEQTFLKGNCGRKEKHNYALKEKQKNPHVYSSAGGIGSLKISNRDIPFLTFHFWNFGMLRLEIPIIIVYYHAISLPHHRTRCLL